jgi:transposase
MTQLGEIVMILDLHRQVAGVSAMARRAGLDRKTVSKVIAGCLEPAIYGPCQRRTTQLQPFEPYLRERLVAVPELTGRRLHCELAALGYRGGYTAATDPLREIRPVLPPPFELRFETPPGQQAQVDFSQFQTEFSDEPGVIRIVWLFSLVLGQATVARRVCSKARGKLRFGAPRQQRKPEVTGLSA